MSTLLVEDMLEHSAKYYSPAPEIHLMKRVCAWCQADLGAVECEAEQGGKVSHGICPQCEADMKREVAS